jgi:tripartite-type tricarboxylate transporter receptor subunit TctC
MRSDPVRHRLIAVITAVAAGVSTFAVAKDATSYPVKPIRVIVPAAPGGPPDIVARALSEKLTGALGQQVIVDNRPGAGGAIGLEAISRAAPDGYTVGVIGMPFIAVTPRLVTKLTYDTARDFVPLALIAWNYNALVIPGGSSARSVPDLIAAAKAKPGVLRFSSGGIATPAHLTGELLKREAHIDITHVPYKAPGLAVNALLGGESDLMIGTIGSIMTFVKSGRLRALATAAPLRIAVFPDLPTFVELGYVSVQMRDWQGVFVPRGTRADASERLRAEISKATATTEVRSRLEGLGMEIANAGPQQATAQIRSDIERWGRLIREANIKAE